MTYSTSACLRLGFVVLIAGLGCPGLSYSAELQKGDAAVTAADDAEFGFRDRLVAKLQKGVRLEVTDVNGPWVRGRVVLDGWIHQKELQRLVLDNTELPPAADAKEAAAALKQLGARIELDASDRVYTVDASDASLTDAAMVYFSHLPELVVAELGSAQITDKGLAQLAQIKSLERLYLDHTAITDEGLKQIANLPNLDVLVLEGTKITGAGLKHLQTLRSLRTLNLSCPTIRDEDLQHLSPMAGLEVLSLQGVKLNGEGLQYLKPLDKLRVLNLNATGVSDEGVGYLQGLPSLRMLYLEETDVTDEAVEQLDETLNSCAIYR